VLLLAGGYDALATVHIEKRIRRSIEAAIQKCGSAAALARKLNVKQPTVSQWRKGIKKPDAVNLIRIQDIGRDAGPS
jgi:transcriptional regulator with XRE-family HTH domain